MNIFSKELCYKILIAILFMISFFVVRIPLLQEPLGFEEGIFADLIVNRPAGPLYSLSGRIDGQNIYSHISHPAGPYELLRLGGFIAQKFLTRDIYLEDAKITPRLRIICAFYQFFFWGLLLVYVFFNRSIYNPWSILIIFAVMLSPLAIKTSVHLQIDNTSGVILCGLAALLLTLAGRPDTKLAKGAQFLLLFTGGFIAGLGKQEWSFALLAAVVSMLILIRLVLFDMPRRDCLKISGCIILGLIAGNTASYLYDPANYSRGLYYIMYFSKMHENSAGNWDFTHWLNLMKLRLPFIYICGVLLLPLMYAWFMRTKRNALSCLVSLYGFFLLGGYVFSDWTHQPRYFCPSLAVLTVSAITLIPLTVPRWFSGSFLAAMCFVFVSTGIFLIGYKPDPNRHLELIHYGLLKSTPGTILYIQSGAGWNKPEIDYQNNNSPFERVQKRIAEEYGKKLINPDNTETVK